MAPGKRCTIDWLNEPKSTKLSVIKPKKEWLLIMNWLLAVGSTIRKTKISKTLMFLKNCSVCQNYYYQPELKEFVIVWVNKTTLELSTFDRMKETVWQPKMDILKRILERKDSQKVKSRVSSNRLWRLSLKQNQRLIKESSHTEIVDLVTIPSHGISESLWKLCNFCSPFFPFLKWECLLGLHPVSLRWKVRHFTHVCRYK